MKDVYSYDSPGCSHWDGYDDEIVVNDELIGCGMLLFKIGENRRSSSSHEEDVGNAHALFGSGS